MKKLFGSVLLGAFLFFSWMTPSRAGAATSAQTAVQKPAAAQEFMGTVVKSDDMFELRNDATKASFTLDDTQRASQFEGKKVKVMGVLDAQTQTIHVQSIQAS